MRISIRLIALAIAFMGGTAIAAPPNVIMVISDDHGWGDYSFMGHEAIRTPNLDRLASQSLTFTRGYVPTSLCRPSLATIITGLYPHQHGITGNDPRSPEGQNGYKLRREGDPAYTAELEKLIGKIEAAPTLPRLLGREGYLSLQTGKWWEGNYSRGGFTHGMTHGDPRKGGRHGDDGLKIGREGMEPIFEFIDSSVSQKKPFFIWYAPIMPHLPHNPPQRLLDKYTAAGRPEAVARYYAMVEWFDETCGQLLEHLDEKGLSENTLVVYVADNGWTQPPVIENGAIGGPRGKRTAYEGGTRTPIMLRWPGHIEPKHDDQTLTCAIDLAPTILAACGLPSATKMTGLNLLNADTRARRDAIFGETFTHDVQDLDNPIASLLTRWCIEGNWKLILPYAANNPDSRPELYDLAGDPEEMRDLAASHPQVVERLATRIEQWWRVR